MQEATLKDTGRFAVPQAVAVGLGFCVESGVKPFMDILTGIYADVLR
jgi:hypothetical protein